MDRTHRPAPASNGGGGPVRFRAVVAYHGGSYHGWAAQPGLPTVEQELTDALQRVLRAPQLRLTCAGRTDAGVHARGQVVHFDAPGVLPPERIVRAVNGVLPTDIRVRDVSVAPPGFDARFGALWRRYCYRVTDGVPDPLLADTVLAVRRALDVPAMDAAVAALVGEHDFGSFCKPRPGATTVRRVLEASWERGPDGPVVLQIRADAFCHSMVRSVVGASLEVGSGRRPVEWIAGLLARPSREGAAPVAPPHGLVLESVGYPEPGQLAARVAEARSLRAPAPQGRSDRVE